MLPLLRRLPINYCSSFRKMSMENAIEGAVVDLGAMRKPYNEKQNTFTENDLAAKEPIGQFRAWFDLACQTTSIYEANAMHLATASKDGKPSGRVVLLKGYSEEGFRFFTNYSSRKGKELEENPFAALTFYWEPLLRSIRIEGVVKKMSPKEADEYFQSRPRGSQIGALVSPQSKPIESRQVLLNKEEDLAKEFADESRTIPRPESWGGYLVVPDVIEFWQGQSTRLHDRIRFRRPMSENEPDGVLTHKGENGWIYERLAP